jgi:hypothetical protein
MRPERRIMKQISAEFVVETARHAFQASGVGAKERWRWHEGRALEAVSGRNWTPEIHGNSSLSITHTKLSMVSSRLAEEKGPNPCTLPRRNLRVTEVPSRGGLRS